MYSLFEYMYLPILCGKQSMELLVYLPSLLLPPSWSASASILCFSAFLVEFPASLLGIFFIANRHDYIHFVRYCVDLLHKVSMLSWNMHSKPACILSFPHIVTTLSTTCIFFIFLFSSSVSPCKQLHLSFYRPRV